MVWRRRRWLLGMRLGHIGPNEEGPDAPMACHNSRIAAVICSEVRTRRTTPGQRVQSPLRTPARPMPARLLCGAAAPMKTLVAAGRCAAAAGGKNSLEGWT